MENPPILVILIQNSGLFSLQTILGELHRIAQNEYTILSEGGYIIYTRNGRFLTYSDLAPVGISK